MAGKIIITLGLCASLLFSVSAYSQSVPPLVNYQGQLTDDMGVPIDDTLEIRFTLFDGNSPGAMVWGEIHSAVVINEGIYNVILGSVTPIAPSLLSSDTLDLYLELIVDGQIMSPKQKLTSTLYALKADTLDGKDSTDFLTPSDVGTMAMQDSDSVNITGGTISNAIITSSMVGSFFDNTYGYFWYSNSYTLVAYYGTFYFPTVLHYGYILDGEIDNTIIGSSTPEEGTFTNLNATQMTADDVYANLLYASAIIDSDSVSYYVDPNGTSILNTIQVNGCTGCDYAENFLVTPEVEAGDVVVLDPLNHTGLSRSTKPYDTAVAGIISETSGIIMGKEDGLPLALAGRALCKVTDESGPILRGDLLTTSSKPGHAMKVTDRQRAIGAIIGKAMDDSEKGDSRIWVLLTQQ